MTAYNWGIPIVHIVVQIISHYHAGITKVLVIYEALSSLVKLTFSVTFWCLNLSLSCTAERSTSSLIVNHN